MLVILDYSNGSVHVFDTPYQKHEVTEENLKKIYPYYKESQCSWMYKDDDINITFHGCEYEEE